MVSRFVTPAGVAVPAVTSEQMREIDRIAVHGPGPSLLQMMENAGRELASTAIEMLGDGWQSSSIVVIAGRGGNGGGGTCAARHLSNRGVDVTVVLTDPDRLTEATETQFGVFRATAGRVVDASGVASINADLVIDAVIGYGLRDAPRDTVGDLVRWMASQTAQILSLDVPSGIDATTGDAPGDHVVAAATLTLALPKTGLAASDVGRLSLADIGIPEAVYRTAGIELSRSIFGTGFRVPLAVALGNDSSDDPDAPGGHSQYSE